MNILLDLETGGAGANAKTHFALGGGYLLYSYPKDQIRLLLAVRLIVGRIRLI